MATIRKYRPLCWIKVMAKSWSRRSRHPAARPRDLMKRLPRRLHVVQTPRNDWQLSQCMQAGLIGLIRVYRYAFSLLLGHCCRFEPSCSTYAMEAITMHGCFKGCRLTLLRVLRCHPWHPGGVDQVPSVLKRSRPSRRRFAPPQDERI